MTRPRDGLELVELVMGPLSDDPRYAELELELSRELVELALALELFAQPATRTN